MTRQLVLNGMLSGIALQDIMNGGYVEPKAIELSDGRSHCIPTWILRYGNHHYVGYSDRDQTRTFGNEGIKLMKDARLKNSSIKTGYFSKVLLKKRAHP